MLKVVYVKVPISTKIKKDTPQFVIEHLAVHDFLKMNNYNIRYIASNIRFDPISLQYCVAIFFRV